MKKKWKKIGLSQKISKTLSLFTPLFFFFIHLAAPSVILAPGYTCELVVTDAGVSLFLQEPGDRLPNEFDWTKSGGVVSQPSVPASAPTGGVPCTLSDSWIVSLK